MAPRDSLEEISLWWNPALRESPPKSAELFLEDKRRDDGAEGLWRVHDDIYDLSSFVQNHPGGSEWLRLTKVQPFIIFHLIKDQHILTPEVETVAV